MRPAAWASLVSCSPELQTERRMKAPAVSEVLHMVEDDFMVDGEG